VTLTKEDLGEIKKIVDKSTGGVEHKLTAQIVGVELKLTDNINSVEQKITAKVGGIENRLTAKIEETKEEILDELGREISDLADINRAVITRTDELDYRLRIVERKLGLKVK
jgi:hypothetical protein